MNTPPSVATFVPLSDVQVPASRRSVRDIGQLAASIEEVGILHPITITDALRLMDGYRRLEACRSLGLDSIPAHVLPGSALQEELNRINVLLRAGPLSGRDELYLSGRHVILCEALDDLGFPTEKSLENRIVAWLRNRGIKTNQQVHCAAGIADIVGGECVYEVELFLTRQKLFEALGQVLLYRQAIDPEYEAAIIGFHHEECAVLAPLVRRLGVSIYFWDSLSCPYQQIHSAWWHLVPAVREIIGGLAAPSPLVVGGCNG